MRSIVPGQRGPGVLEIRRILEALNRITPGTISRSPDPLVLSYDDECVLAVRQFQQERGLVADGIVDSDTYHELAGARFELGDRTLAYHDRMMRGDDVRQLQYQLSELGFHHAVQDGIFGITTDASLRAFQADYGLMVDGECGTATCRALRNLLPKVTGGSPTVLVSQAYRLATGPELSGRYIMLDPVHSPDPLAGAFIRAVTERIREQLELLGANAVLAQEHDQQQTATQRATHANAVGAEIFLSLDVAEHTSANAEGVATYFYGSPDGHSAVGREIGGLVHRELTARTGFVDLGEHPRVFETLRLTRMPAIHIELGYLSNSRDRAMMSDQSTRENIATAVVAGIQRFYLVSSDDYPTGTWQIPIAIAD